MKYLKIGSMVEVKGRGGMVSGFPKLGVAEIQFGASGPHKNVKVENLICLTRNRAAELGLDGVGGIYSEDL